MADSRERQNHLLQPGTLTYIFSGYNGKPFLRNQSCLLQKKKKCFWACECPVGICVPVCMCVCSMLGLLPVRAGVWHFLREQNYNCEWVCMTESDSAHEQERTKPSYILGYNCPHQRLINCTAASPITVFKTEFLKGGKRECCCSRARRSVPDCFKKKRWRS